MLFLECVMTKSKMSLFEYEEGNNKFFFKRHEFRNRLSFQKNNITPLKSLLFHRLSLFWEFFRILGVLPYSKDLEKDLVTFEWLSVPVLYSAILCALVDLGAYTSILKRLSHISSTPKSSFQASTYSYLNVSLLLPIFFIPFTSWADTRKFVKYINEWIVLEKHYKKISSSKSKLKIKKWSKIAVIIILSYGLFTCAGFATFENNVSLLEPFAYFQFLSSIFIMPIYFAFITNIIQEIASNVQSQLARDLKNKSALSKLQQHRYFWLQLRRVTVNVWDFQFKRIAIAGSCGIFAACLAIYNGIENLLLSDDPALGVRSTLMLLSSSLILLLAYVTSRRAQFLKSYVEKNFIHHFYKHRRSLNYYDEGTLAEIKLLNKMFKISNVKISGNGYFEISQSSLISLLSLMATNLLILLQFEIYSRTINNNNPD